MGWGDIDGEGAGIARGVIGSATLLFVTGVYWGSLWVLGGLPPFSQLAVLKNRRSRPRNGKPS